MDTLTARFAEASLALELRTVPLFWDRVERAEDIVQIDITRDERFRRERERFRIYPGHADNRLDVLDADAALQQLVLLVDEPSRAFAVRYDRRTPLPRGAHVVRSDKHARWVEQRTEGRARHFLCGMDEAHLFIALLPDPVATVRAAHDALRAPLLDQAELGAPSATIRQGEWFFVALAADEERAIDRLARKTLRVRRGVGIAEAAGIRRIGRPHLAEEVLVVSGIPDRDGDLSTRVYVRGAVRHPDHATIELPAWRRTLPNREQIEAPIEGIDWID